MLFRLDEDQCARRNAQKYLKVIDPDYYEFEGEYYEFDCPRLTLAEIGERDAACNEDFVRNEKRKL
jgi:hypothetical protein